MGTCEDSSGTYIKLKNLKHLFTHFSAEHLIGITNIHLQEFYGKIQVDNLKSMQHFSVQKKNFSQ